MTKRNQQSIKRSRNDKRAEQGRIIEEKYQEQRRVPPLIPKNTRQAQALEYAATKQMIVLAGSSGSGKTEIAAYVASKLWREGKVDNVIITRPNKSMNGDDAAIPGNDFQKTLPYTMAILMKLKRYLGAGTLKCSLRQDMEEVLFNEVSGIQVYSMEKLNGLSFDSKTLIIADEVQSATVGQVKSLVTRCEKGCMLFVCGDPLQTAITGENGLEYLLKLLENNTHEDIGVVRFKPEDCQREGISAFFTEQFEKEGAWK